MPEPRLERDLVGRALQLRVIEEAIEGARDGRGQVLLVPGEAGIGKTRLARGALAIARSAGLRTAWAAAWEGDGAPPLWPWAELMRQLTGADVDFERNLPSSPDAAAARFHQFASVAR
ncbi:MAG TPA: ATP-binding protein, partial [Acidimicrobiales bacterium]|nr:ATP-binding protein [Acidimicrobiales bacterium]